jgi:hypothetical protein
VLKRQLPHLSSHSQPPGFERLRELYLMVVGVLAPGTSPGHQHWGTLPALSAVSARPTPLADNDTVIGDGLARSSAKTTVGAWPRATTVNGGSRARAPRNEGEQADRFVGRNDSQGSSRSPRGRSSPPSTCRGLTPAGETTVNAPRFVTQW